MQNGSFDWRLGKEAFKLSTWSGGVGVRVQNAGLKGGWDRSWCLARNLWFAVEFGSKKML